MLTYSTFGYCCGWIVCVWQLSATREQNFTYIGFEGSRER